MKQSHGSESDVLEHDTSRLDESSHLIRQHSAESPKYKIVPFNVAIKELKFDDALDNMEINKIIDFAVENDVLDSGWKEREITDPEFRRRVFSSLPRNSAYYHRFKRIYYEAREQELIREASTIAELKHPHLIQLRVRKTFSMLFSRQF